MISKQFSKALQLAVVAVATSACAFAQYGGGGGGTGTGGMGGGTYTPGSRSYGHGALIGGVAAGAGAGVLFLALHHRHHAMMGCVGSDGKTLTADKDKHTYQLTGESVTAGEHVAVVGKKMKGESGLDGFNVISVKKDFGQCQQQSALVMQP